MALIVCKRCKRAFINGPRNESVCFECETKLREIYPAVRNFLRDNETRLYSALEVSSILDIDIKEINGLVSMGLIDDSSQEEKQPAQKLLKVRTDSPPSAPETQRSSGMHVYHKKKKKGDSW